MKSSKRLALVLTFVITACLMAGCGGSDGSSSGGLHATADVAAAKKAVAPYLTAPSEFPVTTPLAKKPAGKRIAFLDCGTPICSLYFNLISPAAQQLDMKLVRIKTGFSPDTVASGFDTVLSGNFDAVFVSALPTALWSQYMDRLHKANIAIVTSGVDDVDPKDVGEMESGPIQNKRAAALLADYVIAKNGGDTNVVFYMTPELHFTTLMSTFFQAEIKRLCPSCKVRAGTIPAASFGTTASSTIVDDLQAHPDTKTAVFAVGEQAIGLPAAFKTAGVKVQTMTYGPDPQALKQIQDGDMAAGLGFDIPVSAWTFTDTIARLTTGQAADPGALLDHPVIQFLTSDNLKGDMSQGWTGYPDFPKRFAALWAQAK